MADYIKISDSSIEITKEVITPTVTTKQTYERGFIESQILAITQQRDALIALKEAEYTWKKKKKCCNKRKKRLATDY